MRLIILYHMSCLAYVENPSQFSNFFNDISLAGLEGLAQIKLESIKYLRFIRELISKAS
jgi:hypothetical protein